MPDKTVRRYIMEKITLQTLNGGAVQATLFEAEGGAWRNEARLRIAAYLKEHIKVSVIA